MQQEFKKSGVDDDIRARLKMTQTAPSSRKHDKQTRRSPDGHSLARFEVSLLAIGSL